MLAVALGACDSRQSAPQSKFLGVDITGAEYGADLSLTDHTGKPRTLADFKGKVTLIFFGFTHCPDVCPTTLADMAQAMKLLGSDANRVQVVFVSVDPGRDTQELLSKFVPSFHPSFIALRGDEAATKKAAQSFHVFYEKVPGKTPESYTMNHFANTFVLDTEGRMRLLLDANSGAEKIAHDVKLLLS
jgi:protein SCO1